MDQEVLVGAVGVAGAVSGVRIAFPPLERSRRNETKEHCGQSTRNAYAESHATTVRGAAQTSRSRELTKPYTSSLPLCASFAKGARKTLALDAWLPTGMVRIGMEHPSRPNLKAGPSSRKTNAWAWTGNRTDPFYQA